MNTYLLCSLILILFIYPLFKYYNNIYIIPALGDLLILFILISILFKF